MSGFWLDDSKINDIMLDSLIRNIARCKHAHFTDIQIRINGKFEYEQADWIKHLQRIETDGPAR